MSKSLKEMFDIYCETPKTVVDWDGLVSEVGQSSVNQLLNLVFMDILRTAINEGWDGIEEGLGDKLARSVAMYAMHHPESISDRILMADIRDIIEVLNDFGEAYRQDQRLPLVVLKEKDTGRIFQAQGNLFDYFDAQDIAEFLDHIQ